MPSEAIVKGASEISGRSLGEAAAKLQDYLRQSVPRFADVRLSDPALPVGAGMSNETILLNAAWSEDGVARHEGLVLRIHPNAVQIFKDSLFREQFEMLRVLYEQGQVRVPEPLVYEGDTHLFGERFFVMSRLSGQVPVSFPPYNQAGFLVDASPAQRRRLWEDGVRQMAAVCLTPLDTVQFLDMPGLGATGFDQHLAYWRDCARWCGRADLPAYAMTERHLLDTLPTNRPVGLSWGDARIGNMMFGDDFTVAGVMDWEQMSLGGALQDLGWWLYFDKIHSHCIGLDRLEGLGDRAETIALWQEVTGLPADDVEWYELFAGYKLAVVLATSGGREGAGNTPNNNVFTRYNAQLMGVDAPQN